MRTGLSKYLEPLDWLNIGASASTPHTAWSEFEERVHWIGAGSTGVAFEMPLRFGAFPTTDEMYGHFINRDWHQFYYENQHLIRHDVMARHLFTSKTPQFTDVCVPSTIPGPDLTQEESSFVQLAMDFGLRQTIGMSFLERPTKRVSIFMLNGTPNNGNDLSELASNHLSELHLSMQFLLEGVRIRELAKDQNTGLLSKRERDCLSWAACGLSTQEIADMLTLTDHTVNEYFASAKSKLRASNRVQAVARAVTLGLIAP